METWALLVCLGAALTSTCASRVDVETVMVFLGDARGAFGQTVAQFGTIDDGGVLVGAPLQHGAVNKMGTIYLCRHRSGKCQEVPVTEPPGAVNTSLGLALAVGGTRALVCGPTVPQTCGENVHLNGFCVLLDTNLQQLQRLPVVQQECPKRSSDVLLLIDGSGSIEHQDFLTMKTFIAEVMKRFKGTDTQFALTQFSDVVLNHFDFNTFRRSHNPIALLNQVQQIRRSTRTATAIWKVLTEMFVPSKGAREDVNKILIVITDGRKYDDKLEYSQVIPLAIKMGVTRYAIGVGSAFVDPAAEEELRTIASKPSEDHVFRVDNFDALQGIQNQLQEKIFAIEGTQSAHSSSFQLEMAQEGFSALLTPEGPVLGAVGAYDWSGGVFVYDRNGETTFVNVSRDAGDMNDAYLGYAAESLSLSGSRALALGAPRYRHVGRLLLFRLRGPQDAWQLVADAMGPQVGSYFGASLCTLDLNGDGSADLVLVGAPHVLRGQQWGPCGRLHPEAKAWHAWGDIDGDRWPEVAVGAPLEDEERGAVYIFRGKRGGITSQYSQRISGARFSSGPRYFGQAISSGRDMTGDRLPDVAVGAQGQVLLLRSQPLLKVRVTVAFQPQEIPAAAFDCQEKEVPKGEVARAQICFLSTKKTSDNFGTQLSTTLRYQAALDPGRTVVRAIFGGSAAVRNGTLQLGVEKRCENFAITFTECPQDTLTPLLLRLTYDATGNPIQVAGGLRPALSEDSEMVAVGTLPFEKDCGTDNICIDDLQMSFNFSGLETIVVGMTSVVDVTVTLHNRGEDSYGTTVQLQHAEAPLLPQGRRAPVLQEVRVPALQLRAGGGSVAQDPLLHQPPPSSAPAPRSCFTVTLDVPPRRGAGGACWRWWPMPAVPTGAPGSQAQRAKIPVKYDVFLVLTSAPDSTTYVNVSTRAGAPTSAPVTHHYEVKNLGQRGLPINVTFLVPTALGGDPAVGQGGGDPRPAGAGAGAASWLSTRGSPTTPRGCGSARCWTAPGPPAGSCSAGVQELEPRRALGFSLGGSLALGWLAPTRQPKVVVVSSAQLLYDVGRYWNTPGGDPAPGTPGHGGPGGHWGGGPGHGVHWGGRWGGARTPGCLRQLPPRPPQVQTEVERLETPNPLPLILGGHRGGARPAGLGGSGALQGWLLQAPLQGAHGERRDPPRPPLGDPQG
ncbi:unnamed protein product [Bubo scandiacus]